MSKPLIIAIDGGAGTGTSTAARGVSEALGIPHLNTGSIYRAVAWACIQAGADIGDESACAEVAGHLAYDFEDGRVRAVNGVDVSRNLYAGSLGKHASGVSRHKRVRDIVDLIQHDFAREDGAVLEGRDIGTKIFPKAPFKFFFVCDPAERARRLQAGGRTDETIETVLARDEADTNRVHGRLVKAKDAIEINTTKLNAAEVVATIVERVVKATGRETIAANQE